MKKQNNKITENQFNKAKESFLSHSLSAEQKTTMLDNILKSSQIAVASSVGKGASGGVDHEVDPLDPVGRRNGANNVGQDVKGFYFKDNLSSLSMLSFIQPHMLKQKTFIAIVAIVLLFAGTTYASTYSLPGDLLYKVKVCVVEPVVTSTKLSEESRTKYRISLIDTRIDELNRLDDTRVANENIVKKSVKITQENINKLEKGAKFLVEENSAKISAKIQAYNDLLGQRVSKIAELKSTLTDVKSAFASSTIATSTASVVHDLKATGTIKDTIKGGVRGLMNEKKAPSVNKGNVKIDTTTTPAKTATSSSQHPYFRNYNATATPSGSTSVNTQGKVEVQTGNSINPAITVGVDASVNTNTNINANTNTNLNTNTSVSATANVETVNDAGTAVINTVTQPIQTIQAEAPKVEVKSWIKSDIFKSI